MSYARFGHESSVYVYAGGIGYECCGCVMHNGQILGFETVYGIVQHLKNHVEAGDKVPGYTFQELGYEIERERIIAIIVQERDTWTRQATFSYKNALTALIEKIK